jgi:hypothetical protein
VEAPQIRLEFEDIIVTMTVLGRDDERIGARGRTDADPGQRARLPEVEALLARGL